MCSLPGSSEAEPIWVNSFFHPVARYTRLKIKADFFADSCFGCVPNLCFLCNMVVMRMG